MSTTEARSASDVKGVRARRSFDLDNEDQLANNPKSEEDAKLPPWNHQLTLRGLIVGAFLGVVFLIITLKLSMGSAGIIPSLNVPGGLLSFVLLRLWSGVGKALPCGGFLPFTVQENAIVQTMVMACSNVGFTGGFGTYLTGMSYQVYLNTGGKPEGDPSFHPELVYDPVLPRIYPYMATTSILGVFLLTNLRKLMIVDWQLPFPSGTASGVMLESFHTADGAAEAMRKAKLMLWTSATSFAFSMFKWFFQGTDFSCGFGVFPTFGLKALEYTWNFDFQQNYIGAGMLCPHIVNWSMLLGAILSWGLLWPVIEKQAGNWYPQDLGSHDFKGMFAYKVFLCLALLMGEGMYMLGRVFVSVSKDIQKRQAEKKKLLRQGLPISAVQEVQEAEQLQEALEEDHLLSYRETPEQKRVRTAVFLSQTLPWWLAPLVYGGLATLSTITIPHIYPPARWYYVLVAYALIPFMAVPNVYGTGLTDWDNCSMYGKLCLFIFAAWAAAMGEAGAVITGLAICGVVFGATSSAAVLMQDFRTGYICQAAPRAMFTAQVIGSIMGVLFAPPCFMLFWSTGQVALEHGPYPAPFSHIYRSMGIIAQEGFGALPKHTMSLVGAFFAAAIIMCVLRDVLPKRYRGYVPSPMAMGIPFYIGAASAIDFWLGSVVMHIWERVSPSSAAPYGSTVGAGLLVGDGVWAIPGSILSIAGVVPPICMGFVNGGSEAIGA